MQILNIATSLLASILLILLTIFVLIKDWRDQVHRYYAFVSMSAFGILITMFLAYVYPSSQYLTQINRFSQMSTTLLFSSILTMSLVFPKGVKKIPILYTLLILLPAFAISFVTAFTDLTITRAYFENGSIVRDYRPGYTAYMVVAFIYLLLGTANFIRKYFKTDVEVYRLQIQYVFIITSTAIILAAICSIIMPKFFNYSELYVFGASIAAFLGVGSFFYSVVTSNLMDITTVLHKTAMHLTLSAIIIAPVYGIVRVYSMKWGYFTNIPTLIYAGIIAILFVLFYIYIQPIIDRLFKRKQYEFENVLNNFLQRVEGIKDFRSVIQQITDTLNDALFLNTAYFVMLNDEEKKYELYYLKGDDTDIDSIDRYSVIIEWFMQNHRIIDIDRVYIDDKSFGEIREYVVDFFINNSIKVILPIYHDGRVLGLFCLGAKNNLSSFKTNELERLQYFQRESNIIISNAYLYEESKREQIISRAVGLSSDILSRAVPVSLPSLRGIKIGAFYIPSHREGMDYFDFIEPSNNGLGVIATGISGVGVGSAIYSVILRSAFHSCMAEAHSTFTVMRSLNNVLYEYSGGKGKFVTAYYYYYDVESRRLMYTNAGFSPLEIFGIERGDFNSCDTEGIPLGYEKGTTFGMGRISLIRGDIGVLYSRALVESLNQRGERFELAQLRGIIKENRRSTPTEIVEIIKERFASFMRFSPLKSDVVVIVLKIM